MLPTLNFSHCIPPETTTGNSTATARATASSTTRNYFCDCSTAPRITKQRWAKTNNAQQIETKEIFFFFFFALSPKMVKINLYKFINSLPKNKKEQKLNQQGNTFQSRFPIHILFLFVLFVLLFA